MQTNLFVPSPAKLLFHLTSRCEPIFGAPNWLKAFKNSPLSSFTSDWNLKIIPVCLNYPINLVRSGRDTLSKLSQIIASFFARILWQVGRPLVKVYSDLSCVCWTNGFDPWHCSIVLVRVSFHSRRLYLIKFGFGDFLGKSSSTGKFVHATEVLPHWGRSECQAIFKFAWRTTDGFLNRSTTL